MLPLAPALFSTTTLVPSFFARGSEINRAMRSVGPPGGNGTTNLMGWVGQFSGASAASAGAPMARLKQAAEKSTVKREVMESPDYLDLFCACRTGGKPQTPLRCFTPA